MTDSVHVKHSSALTRIFGTWPSFHGAEVLSMHFDRDGDDGPSLEARVHRLSVGRAFRGGCFTALNMTDV